MDFKNVWDININDPWRLERRIQSKEPTKTSILQIYTYNVKIDLIYKLINNDIIAYRQYIQRYRRIFVITKNVL